MLHRSSVLTVVTLLGGALLVSVPATAAGETCQGRPATIVGAGPDIQGTEGDDVIVTGASRTTYAGAGDDLICVSPDVLDAVWVYAGDGDDVVDASRRPPTSGSVTRADLGTGLDHYLGNSANSVYDEVHAHGADDNVVDADRVILDASGPLTGPRGTYTSTGWGNADHAMDGPEIRVSSADHDVEIDLAGDVVVAGVQVADIAGFNRAFVAAPRALVRGNNEHNSLQAAGCHATIMGKGGNDDLGGYAGEDVPKFDCLSEITMRGGSGNDYITGGAGRNRLIGNAGNDELRGGRRDDVLIGGRGHDELNGDWGADVLRGNQGRDTLRGIRGRDVLLGGQGRDSADGGKGRDVCVAERERRCER